TMGLLSEFSALQVYGCDISPFLLLKGREEGFSNELLVVCDATRLVFQDDQFEYAYSIGSLEHFTEDGISKFISEAHRVAKRGSFHMLPVSRTGRDEGWLRTYQSFHNNSESWWLAKFRRTYSRVYVLNSSYQDRLSYGRWFVCVKDRG